MALFEPRPRGNHKIRHTSHADETIPVTHGYLKSFDGTKLFYTIEGKGRPLVFCYGLVCSSLHWTYQIEKFHSKYQTIWLDYRGHQNSDIPNDPNSLTIETLASDLAILFEELNIPPAVLLGHSMGASVVLEFYKQNPNLVTGMVLANGTAKRPLETLFHHNIFHSLFFSLKKLQSKSPKFMSYLWKLQKNNPLARTLVSLGGFNPHLTITPLPQQELMHQLIQNSRLEIIPHGSHCPQMDLPELVNLKTENFLNEIGYHPLAPPNTGPVPVISQ